MIQRWFFAAFAAGLLAGCASSPSTPSPTPPPPPPPPSGTFDRWSDPATWGGRLPQAGDEVVIPSGKQVLLDSNPPALRGLTINGVLRLAPQDLWIKADYLMVHGRLEAGSASQPYTHQAVIEITGNNPSDNIMNMGAKVVGVMGGELALYGQPRSAAWTRLAQSAAGGTTELVLQQAVDWPVGAEIVVTSTDHYGWWAGYDPNKPRSERATIKRVVGNRVELVSPLKFAHHGANASGVPQFAEVGLLSRNIVLRSQGPQGGHLMVMGGGRAQLHWIEVRGFGQKGVLGRYPIHFHQLADQGQLSAVHHSSILDSFNRCVVIHGTNRLSLQSNIAHNTLGHCIYLEEGSETGNLIENNLVIGAQNLSERPEQRLISTDDTAAAFWITHPANDLVGNVAVESSIGFWYALPYRPIPFGRKGQDLSWMDQIYPQRTPLGRFENNLAHSNVQDGLHVDGGLISRLCVEGSRNLCPDHTSPTQVVQGVSHHDPRQNPADLDQSYDYLKNPAVRAEFRSFVAYKNGNRGVWLRGSNHTLLNPMLADNAIGATFASNTSYLQGGLVVGESSNQTTRIQNRGLVGFEHYDGHVGTVGTVFRNFSGEQTVYDYCLKQQIPTRNAAIGTLRWTSFGLSGQNLVYGAKFENATPVNLEDPPQPCFNDAEGYEDPRDGYRTAVFYDADGSVSSKAGWSVVAKNPFLLTPACTLQSAWNAYVCPHLYGALDIYNQEADAGDMAPPQSPLRLVRQDQQNTPLWGTPLGSSNDPNRYFQSRLIVNSGGAPTTYSYRIEPGTAHRSKALRVSLYLHRLPNGTFPAGANNAHILLAVPVPGPVFVYRDWWLGENQGQGIKSVATLAELQAHALGNVFYRDGNTVYLKLVMENIDSQYGEGTTFHLCSQKQCN